MAKIEAKQSDTRCQVVIPGLGQCEVEVEVEHKLDGFCRKIHTVGPCSWNGGPVIARESDDALSASDRRELEQHRAWDDE